MGQTIAFPWSIWVFIAFVGFVIFSCCIIRLCKACCGCDEDLKSQKVRSAHVRRRDVETGGMRPKHYTHYRGHAPPAYNTIFMSGSDGWISGVGGGHGGGGGDDTGGCDSGGGDTGGCDSGGGNTGGCDSGGGDTGGCNSGGGCDSGGGGND